MSVCLSFLYPFSSRGRRPVQYVLKDGWMRSHEEVLMNPKQVVAVAGGGQYEKNDDLGDAALDCEEEKSHEKQRQIPLDDGLIVPKVGADEGFQMKIESPKSPIYQVCNQLNDFSSPLTGTPWLVRDSLQSKREHNIANKVFDILSDRDEYIHALNPKPPDEDSLSTFPDVEALSCIERELGRPLDYIYSSISAALIATTSLGQVYKAKLKYSGHIVAVKVQRLGIEETRSDIICHIIQLFNRDYKAMARDYYALNFLFLDVDVSPIVPTLQNSLMMHLRQL